MGVFAGEPKSDESVAGKIEKTGGGPVMLKVREEFQVVKLLPFPLVVIPQFAFL